MEYKIQEETLTAIADAIRQKASTQTQYTPVEMPGAIENIPTSGGGSGATILSGTSLPSNQEGNNGDIYLVTAGPDAAGSIDIVRPQRIQVDYLMNANSTIEFDCTLPAPSNSYDTPWGSRGGVDYFIAYDGGTLRYSFSDVMGNIGSISNYYNKRILITLSKTFCKVEHNGETIFNVAINGGTTASSVYLGFFSLFTDNSGGDLDSTRASGSFHGCKIYENDVLVKNYIPFKDSQDKWCIKETIGNNLFYSVVGEPTGRLIEEGTILSSYVKANSMWQSLIGSDINDVNTSGGVATDYESLNNKPSINSVTLIGNKINEDLGIQTCIYDETTDEVYTMIDGMRFVLATDVKSESLIPIMTAVNYPEGLIESGGYYGFGPYGNDNLWNAFDGDDSTYIIYEQENVQDGWISYEFANDGHMRYVTKIIATFGNYQTSNSISATLYVYDENDNEIEISSATVSGYNSTTYGTFEFTVNKSIKKLKFVFGYKTPNTNIYSRNIQAYGWIES